MTSHNLGQKVFTPKPPIKGSFPLDHDGECKEQMLEYLICMKKNKSDNSQCKTHAKDYLDCRMTKNLMEKQDLAIFGFDTKK
jgi:cytochrome c oxidase assembly protein subunit 19